MELDLLRTAQRLLAVIGRGVPAEWHGEEAITYLKDRDDQWRQMEWIGWYFQRRATDLIRASDLRASDPFRHGATTFDAAVEGCTFDLKAHVGQGGRDWVVLNDREAIEQCLADRGGWGAVIACGAAEYDEDGVFKRWHDALKGPTSPYEQERIRRGARSRRRKRLFRMDRLIALCIESPRTLADAYASGWMKDFQKGMRNADGSRRRAKVQCALGLAPRSCIVSAI